MKAIQVDLFVMIVYILKINKEILNRVPMYYTNRYCYLFKDSIPKPVLEIRIRIRRIRIRQILGLF